MTIVPMKREQMWTYCDVRKVVDIDANDCHSCQIATKALEQRMYTYFLLYTVGGPLYNNLTVGCDLTTWLTCT